MWLPQHNAENAVQTRRTPWDEVYVKVRNGQKKVPLWAVRRVVAFMRVGGTGYPRGDARVFCWAEDTPLLFSGRWVHGYRVCGTHGALHGGWVHFAPGRLAEKVYTENTGKAWDGAGSPGHAVSGSQPGSLFPLCSAPGARSQQGRGAPRLGVWQSFLRSRQELMEDEERS